MLRRCDSDEERWASGAARIYSSARKLNEFVFILAISVNEWRMKWCFVCSIYMSVKGRTKEEEREIDCFDQWKWSSLSSFLSSSAAFAYDQLLLKCIEYIIEKAVPAIFLDSWNVISTIQDVWIHNLIFNRMLFWYNNSAFEKVLNSFGCSWSC